LARANKIPREQAAIAINAFAQQARRTPPEDEYKGWKE